jgi:pimeloyl-ACP methyl ester carboxylesterase
MEVAKSKRPVHVHYGTQDKSATIENQDFIVKHVPQSELIYFEGGHGDFDMNAILERAMNAG